MTHSRLLMFVAALACGTVIAQAQTTWFVAPVAGHLTYGDSKYSSETSYGLAGGGLFGADHSHEVSFEWTYAKLNYEHAPAPGVVGGSITRVDGHVQPLLLHYRYHFGPTDSRLRFFAGPAVGLTRTSGSGWNGGVVSFGDYTGSYRHWAMSAGGSVGAEFEFAPGLALQFGYRYLHLDKVADFTAKRVEMNTDYPINLGSTDTHFLFGALRWTF